MKDIKCSMSEGVAGKPSPQGNSRRTVVPCVDLQLQYKIHQEAIDLALKQICASADFILGPGVAHFEKRFASFLNIRETVGVANGTDALRLAAGALGIGPGDEVLVPANTFIATALAPHALGAVPVPVDVDPRSFLMDLGDSEKRLTTRTKAIIPVHLYGQCLDMDAVMRFAAAHGLVVIEDACQAHGAMWNGKRAGTFGSAGCFSFYPGKNLGAFGDGGLIAANDPAVSDKLRMLRNYGSLKKYHHEMAGENSRLDSLQAAVLNVKLDFLEAWNARRFDAACRYSDLLKNCNAVRTPVFDHDNPSRHVFHLYVIQCEKRDELLAYLKEKGVQAGIHYPVPIHLHRAFESLGWHKGDFPIAESLSENILSLPIFPEITNEQIGYVASAVKDFYGA